MSLLSNLTVPKARESEGFKDQTRAEYIERFKKRFKDPYFAKFANEINEMAEIQWTAHQENRKSPIKSAAGAGFKDPTYELADDWRFTKAAIDEAQKRYSEPTRTRKVLIVSASDRNDKTCPGEVSKSRRLAQIAQTTLQAEFSFETELLDLSEMTSDFGKTIYPCKGCVSTAMPLCHWPCSCYPNYSLGQADDWMNEIYPKWVESHAILIVTPVYWYQMPSALKLMIDRLVCADGGNADPTSTHGKKTNEAKQLEADGWDYPKHLEKRVFGCLVHGDAGGATEVKNALLTWAQDHRMISASSELAVARYIDFYGPYYSSHVALDKDDGIKEEARNLARAAALTVRAQQAGQTGFATPDLKEARPK